MDHSGHQNKSDYKENSLTLVGAVSMGTGVMIGAGILALTGQIAELAGPLFPLAFLGAAIVTAFSAYSYVKMSNAYPSAGGIAMFLQKAYGKGTITASLGVGVLVFAFLINISGNRAVGLFSLIMAIIKIGGIVAFAIGGLWLADFSFENTASNIEEIPAGGFVAAMALAILAYKGFTTITNSGSEIVDPHRNVGRAIIISIVICVVIYFLVAIAVAGNLSLSEIIAAKDFALAEAARPAFGEYGLWFIVALAIVATVSGVIASMFAVSRMLTMLTDMKLVPHSHFGMTGGVQKHALVYTVTIAIFLTIFFDLTRIASLGAIFYLVMDIAVHWGVFRYLRKEINANALILVLAMISDVVVLGAFLVIKAQTDMMVIYVAVIGIIIIFVGERFFLHKYQIRD